MFRSLCKVGATLKRQLIRTEPPHSPSAAKYFLFTNHIQNVIIKNSRVTSTFSCFSTAAASDGNLTSSSSNSFVVSYLINSCGLSEKEAITAATKLNFKTTTIPDPVLVFLRAHGFTELHISKLICKYPTVLQSDPNVTLKPKFDFFQSKGFDDISLANFFSSFPQILARSLNREIIHSFDRLRSIVQSDENVVKMIKRNAWIISADRVDRVMINVEHLRNEGVPETNICNHLSMRPKAFTSNRFEEIIEKVKEMGFNHLETTFLDAVHMLTMVSEATWRKKMDVYKRRCGWSEEQVQSAIRKNPTFMKAAENKIIEVMNFLVNEMDYDSSIVAENPVVFCCSLQDRIIPRFSILKVLASRGLIIEDISLSTLATMGDESFLEKFVKEYEQEVPGLMKVFEGQLNYQELLQN